MYQLISYTTESGLVKELQYKETKDVINYMTDVIFKKYNIKKTKVTCQRVVNYFTDPRLKQVNLEYNFWLPETRDRIEHAHFTKLALIKNSRDMKDDDLLQIAKEYAYIFSNEFVSAQTDERLINLDNINNKRDKYHAMHVYLYVYIVNSPYTGLIMDYNPTSLTNTDFKTLNHAVVTLLNRTIMNACCSYNEKVDFVVKRGILHFDRQEVCSTFNTEDENDDDSNVVNFKNVNELMDYLKTERSIILGSLPCKRSILIIDNNVEDDSLYSSEWCYKPIWDPNWGPEPKF